MGLKEHEAPPEGKHYLLYIRYYTEMERREECDDPVGCTGLYSKPEVTNNH
jgi:hypothetical protein